MAEDQRRPPLTQEGRRDSSRNWPRSLILGGLLGFREAQRLCLSLTAAPVRRQVGLKPTEYPATLRARTTRSRRSGAP